jgi:DNA-binding CsgD family transcriptional regulator
MTAPAAPPTAPSVLRIAITSPDILARIRHVFASRNLEVDIVRLPYVEVAVRQAALAASADVPLHRLVEPAAPAGAAASTRLRAEYRLNVLAAGDRPRADRSAPAGRRTAPSAAPDPVPGMDDPIAGLSHRQREVMALISRGVRNAEIAARLELTEKTVKNHVNRIFKALGADSRVEAVLIWQERQQGAAAHAPAPPEGGLIAAA